MALAPEPRDNSAVRRRDLAGAWLAVSCAAGPEPAAPSSLGVSSGQEPPAASTVGTTSAASRDIAAVEYFGARYPRSNLPAAGTGVGSLGYGTWIKPKPRSESLSLGSVRVAGSVPILDPEPVRGDGKCPRFVRVEHGFVCAGRRATLDMRSAWMQAGRWTEPAPGVMPYQYALSVGAPMLSRPVPATELRWKIGKREQPRMEGAMEGHDELAEMAPIEPNGPMPDFLRDDAKAPGPRGEQQRTFLGHFPAGNMIAFTRAFEAYGETWVLTTELSVIPARGLKRFRVSKFRGVELGSGLELPIAWMRKRDRPKWRKADDGFVETGERWPVKTHVGLTGREEASEKRRFLETREPGVYIAASDATRVDADPKVPRQVNPGGKWIHVRAGLGTLTLYEGDKPVFSTLVSPGKINPTPRGRFFIESKHHYSSMGSGLGSFWIADVPWTIYFERPFAIHASYWHEDFGQRKSGGCINLSPLDAARVFDWVDPALPSGWDTVQTGAMGGRTLVWVES